MKLEIKTYPMYKVIVQAYIYIKSFLVKSTMEWLYLDNDLKQSKSIDQLSKLERKNRLKNTKISQFCTAHNHM